MASAAGDGIRVQSTRLVVDSRGRLCNVCRSIDLEHYHHHAMQIDVSLGSWDRISSQSSCPLCRTVVRSFEQRHGYPQPQAEDEVLLRNHLSWDLGIEMSPYDRLRSAAYSNKFDLRSIANKLPISTYRLVVEIDGRPNIRSYIQYLAYIREGRDQTQFSGRHVDRNKVDFSLLRSWLHRCEDHHAEICADDGCVSRRLPYNLRLIDIRTRSLVRAPSDDTRYLTLSYVWGVEAMREATGRQPVVTNREDIQFSRNDKECTPLPKKLPQTIEDAILLTEKLGYRYLWVDALCIVQNDPTDAKNVHLESMDAIYNCSDLTIVAASSAHADTGLQGISIPRRSSQKIEQIRSLQLAPMSPSFAELENSRTLIWNTRGWTFQEKIFAKRLLLFTDYQVYFRCSQSVWIEEAFMETKVPSKSVEARKAPYRFAVDREVHVPSRKLLLAKMILPQLNVTDEWSYLGNFPDFAAVIREYSQRELSNPDDKFMAIKGILRSLESDAGRFIFGLPEAYFLQSLLWHPESGSECTIEGNGLPSWTWASWRFERGATFDVLDIRVVRIIVVLVRNVYFSIRKGLSRLADAFSSDASPGDASSSTGSFATEAASASSALTATSSVASASASRPGNASGTPSTGLVQPEAMVKPYDWTTFSAMGKATANVASTFGWPLLDGNHTVKQLYFYHLGKSHRIECEGPLTMSTFVRDERSIRDSDKRRRFWQGNSTKKDDKEHSQIATKYQRPVLAIRTRIVLFRIGRCISSPPPQHANETSCFELINKDGLCIGEVWTTLEHACRGENTPLEFLTISWGLSMTKAVVHDKYVPKWDFDATLLPESKLKLLMNTCRIFEEIMNLTSAKHLSATYGSNDDGSGAMQQQPSLVSFFEALLTAKQNEPRPKFLWSTVNLLLVERLHRQPGSHESDDRSSRTPMYRRVGVARAIFDAWMVSMPLTQNIVLA